MSSHFSTRPFAMGALTGVRSFKATHNGELTGVFHKHGFGPGENVADCCIRHSGAFAMTVCGMAKRPPSDHRPGTLSCTCGFYAYFDTGNNPYHHPGHVLALIEGYGLMSVGERGFRCEKGRLVAFIDESVDVPPLKVSAGRWLIAKAAEVLKLGRLEWAQTTVPAAVRRAYPDVPVYRGLHAALAAHPLTRPERPRQQQDAA